MTVKSIRVLLLMMACVSSSAFAYTTDIAGASRTFTLDSTSFFSGSDDNGDQLVAYGEGNITGNAENGNIPLEWDVTVDGSKESYSSDIFQISSIGESSGTFSLSSNIWNVYSRIAIGFKVGNNKSVDWAIIELEKFAEAGVWSTAPNQGGGLSHYMIYTMPNALTDVSQVPLPGAAWLFMAGLFGTVATARRKAAAISA